MIDEQWLPYKKKLAKHLSRSFSQCKGLFYGSAHAGYSNIDILYAWGYIRGLMESISRGKMWLRENLVGT